MRAGTASTSRVCVYISITPISIISIISPLEIVGNTDVKTYMKYIQHYVKLHAVLKIVK